MAKVNGYLRWVAGAIVVIVIVSFLFLLVHHERMDRFAGRAIAKIDSASGRNSTLEVRVDTLEARVERIEGAIE